MGSGDSNANTLLEAVRRVSTAHGRARSGMFSIEGLRLHERAVRGGTRVERALVGRTLFDDPAPRVRRLLSDLQASGCGVVCVEDRVMHELTEGRSIGALVGLVQLPAAPSLESVLSVAAPPGVLLVAVDVADPGNVGALVRTALASGAAAFAAVGGSDPYHPRALRTSMGSLFKLPIARYERIESLLGELRGMNALTIGAVSSGGARPFDQPVEERVVAVFLGSEAFGLPDTLVGGLDRLVTVPMASGVDSFSVNAVAAVLLYEIHRQAAQGAGC
jgi:TrmH family RNA methyltransferase